MGFDILEMYSSDTAESVETFLLLYFRYAEPPPPLVKKFLITARWITF